MLIRFSANVQTLVIGGGGGVAMATLSIWVALPSNSDANQENYYMRGTN